MIAAGGQHTCAITRAGGAKCWGENRLGQVGSPATPNGRTPVPVNVARLGSGVKAIASGGQHTCTLTRAGGVKCWGVNGAGQLGTGSSTLPSTTPVDVAGLAGGVTAIAAGQNHTCAITRAGGVKCWGSNRDGELGNGLRTDSYTPVDVMGLTSGVSAIAAGEYHTCAAIRGGGVKCWGYNFSGQLGNGSIGPGAAQTVPVDVAGLAGGVTAIAAGWGHTCAITRAGGVKCWGDNSYGQLGNGSRKVSTTPVNVAGLAGGVRAVAAGHAHTCAITRAGGVKCWGANPSGQLGNGSTTTGAVTKPVDVRLR